jgi:hypothetical protein
MRIPVTRNFDTTDLIGMLTLRDDVEIPPESVFSLSFVVLEWKDRRPVKIQLRSISLIPDEDFVQHVQHRKAEVEALYAPKEEPGASADF